MGTLDPPFGQIPGMDITLPATPQSWVSLSTRGSPSYPRNPRIGRGQRPATLLAHARSPFYVLHLARPSRIIPASSWTSWKNLLQNSRESFLKLALPSMPFLHKSLIHTKIGIRSEVSLVLAYSNLFAISDPAGPLYGRRGSPLHDGGTYLDAHHKN